MTIRAIGSSLATTITKMNTGTSTPAANGVLTSFTIPHGLGAVPKYANVAVGNVLSSALYFVSSDATNITVTYAVAPLAGALAFSWIAVT